MHTILLTGGAGFIGSHLTRLFVKKYPHYSIVNLDKLTYAGNLENLRDIENEPNYQFIKGDITDLDLLRKLFAEHKFTAVLHCAAESHVDRSITDPLAFVTTNVLGTGSLLVAAKEAWAGNIWLPWRNRFFYRRDCLRPPQPLLCLQSFIRSYGSGILSYL
jgi:dTDP-glucose 4,6-dehydratase